MSEGGRESDEISKYSECELLITFDISLSSILMSFLLCYDFMVMLGQVLSS